MINKWRTSKEPPGLPPAGADAAVFGVEPKPRPYLERVAMAAGRRALYAEGRRERRRKARRALVRRARRASRLTSIRVLEAAGAASIIYAGWLIWVPLAWILVGALLFTVAALVDKDEEGDER